MDNPTISVIIATFQRRDLLEETLKSMVGQTLESWECLIVDDGSTDGTREMVLNLAYTDPRFRWFEKPSNRPRGPAASRNIGFAASRGEFILYFDSDDLLPPDHLKTCVERLGPAESDAIVCRIRFFPEDHPDGGTETPPMNPDDFIGRGIAMEHAIFTQNIVWRRSLLESIEPQREDISSIQDLEYAVRALLKSRPPILSEDLRVLIRRHEISITYDPNPKRFAIRNLHRYDAYHAIVRSMERHGYRSPIADAYCGKRRYDLVVEVLKRGYPSLMAAKRHLHLLYWSILERRKRPIFRLIALAPVFWSMAFVGALRRRI